MAAVDPDHSTGEGEDTFISYEGYLVPNFPLTTRCDVKGHMEAIQNLDSRDTDVLLCTGAKSGTNWMFEIINMLLNGTPEYVPEIKGLSMMEAQPIKTLEALKEPRFMNTHIPVRHLPRKHIENGYKIVHVIRNPKDVMVSFFNHQKIDRSTSTSEFPGTWEDYVKDTCLNIHNFYGGWFNYEKEFEDAIESGKITNVHTVYFEELKKDPFLEIEKVANYLGVPYTQELIQCIAERCSFEKLSKATKTQGTDIIQAMSKNGTNFFFRKGQVGDWKNWFTVAQNEMYDAVIGREMENSKLKMIFEL